jgi:hypothetical protein
MKASDIEDFVELLEVAELQASREWDMGFVCGMRIMYDVLGEDWFVSEAQLEQLKRIAGV